MTSTRRLVETDADAAFALAGEAFGYTTGSGAPTPPMDRPGRHEWGGFDGDDLVARVAALELGCWFSGVAAPTTGIAGVAVAAEARGRGQLDAPMRAALLEGHERGDVLAALYPTAPGIYRRYGFETVSSLLEVELRTADLPALRVDGVTLRRAEPADAEAVRAAYDAWARAQDGPLTRREPVFSRSPLDDALVTLAEVDGEVAGYLRWHRGEGYDERSVLVVDDLVALDGRAAAALWSFLAGWATVAPTVRLTTSGADPARLLLRGAAARVVRDRPYMLRVLDVPGALALRPAVVDGSASITVTADAVDERATFRLRATGGAITCGPATETDAPTFSHRGVALWYAGAQTCATLRMAGLLTGPTAYDAFLDRVLERRPLHIRDYF